MNDPKVFVSQEIGVNYSPAEEFGEVVILSLKEIVPYEGSLANTTTVAYMEKVLAEGYRPGVDYLLPTGSVLAMAHMFSSAFAKKGPVHLILKWDARAQKYYRYRMKT